MIEKTQNGYMTKIICENTNITIFISTILKNSFSIELTNEKNNSTSKRLYLMNSPFMEIVDLNKNKTLSIIPTNLRKKTLKTYNDFINKTIKELYLYYGL